MSYPGVDPFETEPTKPAETQVVSEGTPENHSPENEKAPEPALTDEQRKAAAAAAIEAVKNQFDLTPAWEPKQIVKFIIDCPSGQRALVKHLGTTDLINYKLMEDLDFFTKKLFATANAEESANGTEQETIWQSLEDIEKRLRFFDVTGKLIAASSVSPKVVYDPMAKVTDEETGDEIIVFGYQVPEISRQIELFGKPVPPLKPGQTYAGTIDFSDRMVFFQELSKPLAMIEPFREGQDALLANLESSEKPGVPTEQPV